MQSLAATETDRQWKKNAFLFKDILVIEYSFVLDGLNMETGPANQISSRFLTDADHTPAPHALHNT